MMSELKKHVSRRQSTETQLQQNAERLAGIIDSAMDAIITVDAEQRVTLFNTSAEKMFLCSAPEALGQSLDVFIPSRFREDHHRHLDAFGATHATRRAMGSLGTVYGLRANGEE